MKKIEKLKLRVEVLDDTQMRNVFGGYTEGGGLVTCADKSDASGAAVGCSDITAGKKCDDYEGTCMFVNTYSDAGAGCVCMTLYPQG